jgi:uncharacterized membrane protein
MLKSISKTLLTGFITLLPIVLTVYLLYWLAVSSERVMGGALRWALPNAVYFPGMGMLAGLLLMFIVGLMMKAYIVRQVFGLWEKLLYSLPLVKTVYRAIRDFFDFFSPKDKARGQVVVVTYNDIEMIGFITQDDENRLPELFRGQDKVLVYLPMSYMIGGFTVLLPRKDVRSCKMSMDEAMRFVMTAGITGKNPD